MAFSGARTQPSRAVVIFLSVAIALLLPASCVGALVLYSREQEAADKVTSDQDVIARSCGEVIDRGVVPQVTEYTEPEYHVQVYRTRRDDGGTASVRYRRNLPNGFFNHFQSENCNGPPRAAPWERVP